MSWTKLTSSSVSSPGGVSVRIAPLKKSEPEPRLQIRVNSAVSLDVRLTSENSGRADVFLGSGAEAGRMKVISAKDGQFRCRRGGKSGGVLLVVDPPPGAPAEWQITKIGSGDVIVDGVDGVDFKLPWHRRAADRVVEEPADDGPVEDDPEPSEKLKALLAETPPWEMPAAVRTFVKKQQEHSAPPTLDEIEEDARPKPNASGGHLEPVVNRALETIADKPVNGTAAKTHVYADSPSGSATKPFAYKDRTVALDPREHAIATKLCKAMKAAPPGSFIDYGILTRLAETREIDVLHTVMTRLTEKLETIGLVVGVKKKMGYWLKEMEEIE